MTVISILLPTRGRPDTMVQSVRGLIEAATHPDRLEILFGVDDDDPATLNALTQDLQPVLEDLGVSAQAVTFRPQGYGGLHTYVNELARRSTGEWLFFWNDDAIMDTPGWDNMIRRYDGEFKLLAPTDNHNGHPYAIFPIVPRDWLTLIGHLSLNAQNDAWLSQIAYMLDIFERIDDLKVTHDRADITGNNNDATFAARTYKEGNPSDPEDFGHPDMFRARISTASRIAWFMDRTGRDTSWWKNVAAGKQDPFEKMVVPAGVLGAGQLPAKPKPNKDIQ
jgi:hypothetical protein